MIRFASVGSEMLNESHLWLINYDSYQWLSLIVWKALIISLCSTYVTCVTFSILFFVHIIIPIDIIPIERSRDILWRFCYALTVRKCYKIVEWCSQFKGQPCFRMFRNKFWYKAIQGHSNYFKLGQSWACPKLVSAGSNDPADCESIFMSQWTYSGTPVIQTAMIKQMNMLILIFKMLRINMVWFWCLL